MALLAGGISKIATMGAYYFFIIRIEKKKYNSWAVCWETRLEKGEGVRITIRSGRQTSCKESQMNQKNGREWQVL